jgi:hypothetical protein
MTRALLMLCLVSRAWCQTRFQAAALHDRIAQVCPVDRISIGSFSDKSTWSFTPSNGSSQQQRANARAIVTTWTDIDWIGTPDQRRETAISDLIALHIKVLALQREQSQNGENSAAIQARIDAIQNQIIVKRQEAFP